MSAIYKSIIKVCDSLVPKKLQPLWSHPAGPKTVFFWAPSIKWGLVIAGLGDINRPVEKMSVSQQSALLATGTIWSRYSMAIIPKNYLLFSVNVTVAVLAFYQCVRIIINQKSKQETNTSEKKGEKGNKKKRKK